MLVICDINLNTNRNMEIKMAFNTEQLKTVFSTHPDWVVEQEGDCVSISNDEGIDVFVYAGETQVVAESVLFPVSSVTDASGLNELILKSHQLVPLSTVGISSISGQEYYVAFGALSVDSKDSVLVEEIESLFANIPEFLELYEDYIN